MANVNKTYTFTGRGDFSDFNEKAREAASNMSSSFKKGYEDMLKESMQYSTSSKKQFDYLKSNIDKFREQQGYTIDNAIEGIYDNIKNKRLEEINKLNDWRKGELSEENIKERYEEEYGQKYDNMSPMSRMFRDKYIADTRNQYQSEREKVEKRYEGEFADADKLREVFTDQLDSIDPKDGLEKLRLLAREQIVEAKKQNQSIVDIISGLEESGDVDKQMLASMLREEVMEEHRASRRNDISRLDEIDNNQRGGSGSILGDLTNFSYLDKMFQFGRGIMRSNDGTESLRASVEAGSSLAGGITQLGIGVILKHLGIESEEGRKLISSIAGKAAEGVVSTLGEGQLRAIEEQNKVAQNLLRYRSLTGSETRLADLSSMGYDFNAVGEETISMSRARGRRVTQGEVETSLALQKGYEIDKETLSSLMEIQRTNNKDLGTTIARVISEGERNNIFQRDDRSFLPEFLNKFTNLQREFLKTSTTVTDSSVLSTLSMFDKIGGQWSARDFRSEQNISSVQGALRNPQTDADRALDYALISRENPNLSMFGVLEEMEKGLNSPNRMKNLLGFYDQQFGHDPDTYKMQLMQRFGLSASATSALYDNRYELMNGQHSESEIKSIIGVNDFRSEADRNTFYTDRQQVSITNSFVQGLVEGAEEAMKALSNTLANALRGTKITMINGELEFPMHIEPVYGNKLKLPTQQNQNNTNTNTKQRYNFPEGLPEVSMPKVKR